MPITTFREGTLITHRWLEKQLACAIQASRFKNLYPNGMKVNTRNLNKARTQGLNVRWLVERVLTIEERYEKLRLYSGANPLVQVWTKEMAPKLHAAFIKILKERGPVKEAKVSSW